MIAVPVERKCCPLRFLACQTLWHSLNLVVRLTREITTHIERNLNEQWLVSCALKSISNCLRSITFPENRINSKVINFRCWWFQIIFISFEKTFVSLKFGTMSNVKGTAVKPSQALNLGTFACYKITSHFIDSIKRLLLLL